MKFIMCEELDSNTPVEEIEELKKNVEVELKEDLGYRQTLISDSRKLAEDLTEFIQELELEDNYLEFISEESLKLLTQTVDVLEDFNFSYSLHASKKARAFLKDRQDRGL